MQTKEGKKFKISLEWYSEGAVPLKQEIYATPHVTPL